MAVVLDDRIGVPLAAAPASARAAVVPVAAVPSSDVPAQAPPIVVRPKAKGVRTPAQRRLLIIAGVVAAGLVLALIVLSQWGFVADKLTWRYAGWPSTSSEPVAKYSSAQGAQDAPRSEVMEGRRADREKCLETLRLRRVTLETARDTCEKMIEGIYHG